MVRLKKTKKKVKFYLMMTEIKGYLKKINETEHAYTITYRKIKCTGAYISFGLATILKNRYREQTRS